MRDKPLTEKELRVLREFIPDAPTNPEIAAALGLELNTVKFHMFRIRKKLGARNRTHLAVKVVDAIKRGEIEL